MGLSKRFIESGGAPIRIGNDEVIRMDRIPITQGLVVVNLLKTDSNQGVALKSAQGQVFLSDGKGVPLVHIWSEPGLPTRIEHNVVCPNGELRIWNIYKIFHTTGVVTEDRWTNNAGMIVSEIQPGRRLYRCSDGIGDFDPSFSFEIAWFCEDVSETPRPKRSKASEAYRPKS